MPNIAVSDTLYGLPLRRRFSSRLYQQVHVWWQVVIRFKCYSPTATPKSWPRSRYWSQSHSTLTRLPPWVGVMRIFVPTSLGHWRAPWSGDLLKYHTSRTVLMHDRLRSPTLSYRYHHQWSFDVPDMTEARLVCDCIQDISSVVSVFNPQAVMVHNDVSTLKAVWRVIIGARTANRTWRVSNDNTFLTFSPLVAVSICGVAGLGETVASIRGTCSWSIIRGTCSWCMVVPYSPESPHQTSGDRWQVVRNGHGKLRTKGTVLYGTYSMDISELCRAWNRGRVSSNARTPPINTTAKAARMELWR